MNRNAEYEQLMLELSALPIPEGSVKRAMRMERCSRYLLRPIASIAAVFALFVILINFCAPVAYAVSRIPGLRELAEAVTFSRSLSDAVDNHYVQPVDLQETDGDITVSVEYLIVDQKNVTVFFRFLSPKDPTYLAEPEVFAADGTTPLPCTCGFTNPGIPSGDLHSLFISFLEEDVPSTLYLRLKILNTEYTAEEPMPAAHGESLQTEPPFIAEFGFLLECDPDFAAQGKHRETDARIVLGDQVLRITNIDIYPTYLSFSLQGEETNTAWLKSLRFYLVTDQGDRFDPISNGISATGSPDTPEMVTYRADSTFFYQAKTITLYVTGAVWLDKDRETTRIDLRNAKADFLPEGAELVSAQREGSGWTVTVMIDSSLTQVFMSDYFDPEGKQDYFREVFLSASMLDGRKAPEGYSFERYSLNDYPYDEVWLSPRYSRSWTAETPVEVTIPLE